MLRFETVNDFICSLQLNHRIAILLLNYFCLQTNLMYEASWDGTCHSVAMKSTARPLAERIKLLVWAIIVTGNVRKPDAT